MVIYFSGTGNSKFIANVLGEKLGDTVVDGTAYIKRWEEPDFNSDKPYIFVAPIYAWRFPRVFQNWIKKGNFGENKKAYFVLTCGGSTGSAERHIRKFSKKMGIEYMGSGKIVMPDNYILMFDTPTEREIEVLMKSSRRDAEKIAEKISEGETLPRIKGGLGGWILSGIVNSCFYKFSTGAKKFRTTGNCIACGKCVENCMLNNIKLVDGKPVWSKNCTHCMACISKCPTGTIEYGKRTEGMRKYVCPEEK